MMTLRTITFIWIAIAGALHAQRTSVLEDGNNGVTSRPGARQPTPISHHHESIRIHRETSSAVSTRRMSSPVSIPVDIVPPTKSTKKGSPDQKKKLPASSHQVRKPPKVSTQMRRSSEVSERPTTSPRAQGQIDKLFSTPEKRTGQLDPSEIKASSPHTNFLSSNNSDLLSPAGLCARNGLSEQDFDTDRFEIQEVVSFSKSTAPELSKTRRLDATIRSSNHANAPVAVSRTPLYVPPPSLGRTVTPSYGPTARLPQGPSSDTIRSSAPLPFVNQEGSSRSRAALLSTRSSDSHTASVVVPPPVTRPTTSAAGCQCKAGAAEGMYCGYCSAVISCNKYMGCLNNAYGCSARGCVNYGMLDTCYRAAITEDQVYCPFFW